MESMFACVCAYVDSSVFIELSLNLLVLNVLIASSQIRIERVTVNKSP